MKGAETILLVEDEDSVRRVVARMLEHAGYHLISAASGPEAITLAGSYAGSIELVVTDVVMPVMKGPKMVAQLCEGRPGLRVLYLSGYTDATVSQNGLLDARANFLQKPFASDALTRKVREVLDEPVATAWALSGILCVRSYSDQGGQYGPTTETDVDTGL